MRKTTKTTTNTVYISLKTFVKLMQTSWKKNLFYCTSQAKRAAEKKTKTKKNS